MATVERDRAGDCRRDCGLYNVCEWNARIDIPQWWKTPHQVPHCKTNRGAAISSAPVWIIEKHRELHRVQTRGSKTALLYVGERNAHTTRCERFIKAVYTSNKVLLPDNNGSKISRGEIQGAEKWRRARDSDADTKWLPPTCAKGAHSVRPAWPGWISMHSSPGVLQYPRHYRACFETDESKRRRKKWSRLINPLAGMVGVEAWNMPP